MITLWNWLIIELTKRVLSKWQFSIFNFHVAVKIKASRPTSTCQKPFVPGYSHCPGYVQHHSSLDWIEQAGVIVLWRITETNTYHSMSALRRLSESIFKPLSWDTFIRWRTSPDNENVNTLICVGCPEDLVNECLMRFSHAVGKCRPNENPKVIGGWHIASHDSSVSQINELFIFEFSDHQLIKTER